MLKKRFQFLLPIAMFMFLTVPEVSAQTRMRALLESLQQLKSDIVHGSDFDAKQLGNRIHTLHTQIWRNAAKAAEGTIKPVEKRRTFYGKKVRHGYAMGPIVEHDYAEVVDGNRVIKSRRGPAVEVYIEKNTGSYRADRIVVDHRTKTITVADITA